MPGSCGRQAPIMTAEEEWHLAPWKMLEAPSAHGAWSWLVAPDARGAEATSTSSFPNPWHCDTLQVWALINQSGEPAGCSRVSREQMLWPRSLQVNTHVQKQGDSRVFSGYQLLSGCAVQGTLPIRRCVDISSEPQICFLTPILERLQKTWKWRYS